ncbi:RabGAP/TBC [Basidiobolus meristosporus CBS 931.73]|uniref:RabGAP/TBC n=1 Tax=Basidiobolus meristosporus CBS 931.73 TaxID=1314790 RepID=A0A1Y1XZH5_9FUNG|nr:RabGAP/TBC [Basidiobolus meristosporus CBS 931.73]|eukprot:ORX91118.1 RabGAP/TBC [Basidiobolus meristosporus CBS 931.73]
MTEVLETDGKIGIQFELDLKELPPTPQVEAEDTGSYSQASTTDEQDTVVNRRRNLSTYSTSRSEIRMSYQSGSTYLSEGILDLDELAGQVDRYGFFADDDSASSTSSSLEKEARRALKWKEMVLSKTLGLSNLRLYSFKESRKLVRRTYKGVPDCWRGEYWYFLATRKIDTKTEISLTNEYKTLSTIESKDEVQIDLDIPRTLQDNILFKQRYGLGQQMLFKVLTSFSNYDQEVGYCQGMASVASALLAYMSEEKSFVAFICLFQHYSLREMYLPGFPKLMETFYVQARLMKKHSAKLLNHLNKLDVQLSYFAARWYLTLFLAGVVPHQTSLRIWDVFLLHGLDMLICVSVALLKYHEATLLKMGFEEIMSFLNGKIPINNDDFFIVGIVKSLYERRSTHRIISKARDEYRRSNPAS